MTNFPFSSPTPGADLDPLRGALIMMVDDEPVILQVIQALLEEGGYAKFVSTSQGLDAIDLLLERHPDVLLLDLMMPDMDGLQILSRMRTENILRDIPVLVLTSSKDPAAKMKALELGATDFLAKPVDPGELLLRLRNTLNAKAYRDRLANYDSLTGTPNRKLFTDRLQWALGHAERYRHDGAILHVGLDEFRRINAELGPRLGDVVLQRVAQRLENCLRTTDTVVRLGDGPSPTLSRFAGDEFNFLLPLIRQTNDAARVAERIVVAVASPFHVSDQQLALTCSIGISLFSKDGHTADLLMRNAAIAMQRAKEAGKNTFQFYSGESASMLSARH
ncbi:MAG: diguanylate cyclase [Betaproteobacteria bacterium]|nr:diguanylate cyclase [Betaproteobacteria bacterium]